MLIETIGCSATAPGATGAAAAALTGDSLTVRNARGGSRIKLLNLSGTNQTAGFCQITSPNFNDTTRGIRAMVPAQVNPVLLGLSFLQDLIPQNLLSVTIAGSATAGDVEQAYLWIYYEDMPGMQGRYLTKQQVRDNGIRAVTVANSITTTTGPGWTGSQALNAGSDLLRPNTDYALVGIIARTACGAIGVRSPDWANARIAVPGGAAFPVESATWFCLLSDALGMPCIPVLNSGNKTGIFIDAATDENAAAVPFSLNLIELPSGLGT